MIAATLYRAVALVTTLGVGPGTAEAQFRLTSTDIKPGGAIAEGQVFNSFGCSGQNLSPALAWSGAPRDTKSFALLLHDPDAPTGGAGFWHWIAFDIAAGTTGLPRGAGKSDGSGLPPGAASVANDYGTQGYGGTCPPAGDKPHRYNFTLYALKVAKLDIPKGASASVAGFMINANAIAKATLTGRYGRTK